VILIKLADRLHNMRTVYVLKPDKQKAVAEETMEVSGLLVLGRPAFSGLDCVVLFNLICLCVHLQVWCTMAECLGWDAMKSEMEDLCFAVLAPEQYCALRTALDRLWSLPTLKVHLPIACWGYGIDGVCTNLVRTSTTQALSPACLLLRCLQVVEEQADSSQLPPNALAPAPPLTARGRKAAAAAAARREIASNRAAAAAASKVAAAAAAAPEPAAQRVPAVAAAAAPARQPVSAGAIASSPSATRGSPVAQRSAASGPSSTTTATLVRPAPATTMVAVADPPASSQEEDIMGGQGEPAPFIGVDDTSLLYTAGTGGSGSGKSSREGGRGWAGPASGGGDISLGEVNLGIRITATPGPEDSSSTQASSSSSSQLGGARWDLVSWSLPTGEAAQGASSSSSSSSSRFLQPRLVTLESGGPIGSSAVDLPGSGGGPSKPSNSSSSSSVVTDQDMEDLQRHLDRLQSHAAAGPGPASQPESSSQQSTHHSSQQPGGSLSSQDVGDSGMQRIMFDFSFDAASMSFDSAGEEEPEQQQQQGRQRKAPPQIPLLPARFLPPGLAAFLPLLTPTALSSSMPNANSHPSPEPAATNTAPQQQQQSPAHAHHQVASAAAREIASGAAALATRIIAAAHSQGSAVAAAARRATPLPPRSKPPAPQPAANASSPQQQPEAKRGEQRLESSPPTSSKPAGLPGLGLMPLGPSKPSGNGGSNSSSGTLTQQQERLKSLVSTVVPFDSVNFKDTRRNLSISARRGLEVGSL
jgi:hypothetical protein